MGAGGWSPLALASSCWGGGGRGGGERREMGVTDISNEIQNQMRGKRRGNGNKTKT